MFVSLNLRVNMLKTPKPCLFEIKTKKSTRPRPGGVSTQLQSSGLVAHENSTFRNLALAVSGPFMA